MSTTSPEIVRWKYHARELQTTTILNEAEEHEEAAKKLLTLTQGEIPLMRYRRDLAIQKFSLSSTLDHGLLGYIPTKIEGVDLRLWYPRADTLPRLSFMVKPFEVEV